MEHFLTGTYTDIPYALRILLVLALRVGWYLLVAVAFLGLWQLCKVARAPVRSVVWWGAAFVLYTNIMYSFFAHAEVRYAIPIIPWYFLGVVAVLASIMPFLRKENTN